MWRRKGEGRGGVLTLKATGILNYDDEPGGTMLVDACNVFNELIRLEMLWTVHHRWLARARFAFNCYRRWV